VSAWEEPRGVKVDIWSICESAVIDMRAGDAGVLVASDTMECLMKQPNNANKSYKPPKKVI